LKICTKEKEIIMKCPICTTADLLMSERLGIEIDYCPQCRGVWLDRGELDKIIERSAREPSQVAAEPAPQAPTRPPAQPCAGGHGYREGHHDDYQGYRGKKSIWKELFD
jgi:Zn-finger nucleic acid-binding protein